MLFRILAVGDVVGNPGLDFAAKNLRRIKKEVGADFVVVNGENAKRRRRDAQAVRLAARRRGGRHHPREPHLDPLGAPALPGREPLRPAPGQLRAAVPGRGAASFRTPFGPVLVVNLLGRFTLDPNTDSPFLTADALLEGTEAKMILVDFHAEATSEKLAMGYYLDGRVSAVWGTHTHVQTSDARILPNGTGYITDLGMTGPAESVIGIKPEQSIGKFLGDVPRRYDCAPGPAKLEGAVFELDSETGACLKVEAVRYT